MSEPTHAGPLTPEQIDAWYRDSAIAAAKLGPATPAERDQILRAFAEQYPTK